MLRTRNLITRFEELDEVWAFKYYLKLSENLEGQSINIHSPLNSEKTPSFFLFCQNGRYFFKDFSSCNAGDVYNLVKALYKHSNRADAITRCWNDYQSYLDGAGGTWKENDYSDVGYQKKPVWFVDNVELRKWDKPDAAYWKKYFVTSKLLEFYNVAAVKTIFMKRIAETVQEFKIEKPLSYAYYDNRGVLYRVYNPEGEKRGRHMKVRSGYIQGSDQLQNRENLLITKSLKDVVTFRALGIDSYDCVSSDSENTPIPAEVIAEYKLKYKKIQIIFDNDDAGKRAQILYKEKYSLESAGFNLGFKDISDTVAALTQTPVKEKLLQLL